MQYLAIRDRCRIAATGEGDARLHQTAQGPARRRQSDTPTRLSQNYCLSHNLGDCRGCALLREHSEGVDSRQLAGTRPGFASFPVVDRLPRNAEQRARLSG